jgi:ribosomal protein L37AE/L43A
MDFFPLLLAALIGAIVWTIARVVRRTNAQIADHLRGTDPRKRTDFALKLAQEVRARADAVRCPHCAGHAFAMLDKEGWWKCETCHQEFEGPAHLPPVEGAPVSGHPTGA